MDTKMAVQMDEMEAEIIIQALTKASGHEIYNGNAFKGRLNDIIARKLIVEKSRFQDRVASELETKYGIKK